MSMCSGGATSSPQHFIMSMYHYNKILCIMKACCVICLCHITNGWTIHITGDFVVEFSGSFDGWRCAPVKFLSKTIWVVTSRCILLFALCELLYSFFEITQYNSDTHNTRILTSLWTHIHKSYLYKHLRRLSRQILKIDEVTTGASPSTGTSPTTECWTMYRLYC